MARFLAQVSNILPPTVSHTTSTPCTQSNDVQRVSGFSHSIKQSHLSSTMAGCVQGEHVFLSFKSQVWASHIGPRRAGPDSEV